MVSLLLLTWPSVVASRGLYHGHHGNVVRQVLPGVQRHWHALAMCLCSIVTLLVRAYVGCGVSGSCVHGLVLSPCSEGPEDETPSAAVHSSEAKYLKATLS